MKNIKNKLIKWLGGYTEPLSHEALTQVVKRLYNTISLDDLLREEKGKFFYENKEIHPDTMKAYQEQAKSITQMKVWQILIADAKYQANKRMFELSQTEQDLIAGKFILYTLDILKTRLESLSKGSGHFNVNNYEQSKMPQ